MNINDLRPADILLFSGEKKSWISQAIMFLTDSEVSHAAIASEAPEILVEETPPAIRTTHLKDRIDDRKVHVMRSKQNKAMHPVVNAAMHYLNEEEPYPMSNLYLVGLLLLYRKFTPDNIQKKIMIKIFRTVAAGIIGYVNKHKYPGKLPMVCSQFVYQCYADAGPEYRLHIKHGTLLHALMAVKAEELNVLDYTIHKFRTDRSVQARTLSQTLQSQPYETEEKPTEDALAKELMEAMQGQKMMAAISPDQEQSLNAELVLAVNEFAHAVYMSSTGTTQPLTALAQAQDANVIPVGLGLLKAEESFFVAPGDLLRHCKDIEKVGVITAA